MSYTNFFVASVTVAGALTGLLFVALSVAQTRAGGSGSLERQAVAATAFTALVDALWVSLVALLPGNNIPTASLFLGLLGLTSTASLTFQLWRARTSEDFRHRWPVLLSLIAFAYVAQTVTAITSRDSVQSAHSTGAAFVLAFFAVGIGRSWELLGVRGGGLLDFLVTRGDQAGPGEARTSAERDLDSGGSNPTT